MRFSFETLDAALTLKCKAAYIETDLEMKSTTIFVFLSLFSSYYARLTRTIQELNYMDGFGGDGLFESKKVESTLDQNIGVGHMMSSNKLESESLYRDPVYEEIMKEVDSESELAIAKAIKELREVLMLDNSILNGSTNIGESLLAKIEEFKRKVISDIGDDLVRTVESFKASRSTQGPLTDDERNELIESLKSKFEDTFMKDLAEFQNDLLPGWVNSVRIIWKGIEKKVTDKIDQFKKHVHKNTKSTETCGVPNYILVGTNGLSAVSASKKFNQVDLSKRSLGRSFGKITVFILAIAGVIALAIGAPLWFYILGVFCLIDLIVERLF